MEAPTLRLHEVPVGTLGVFIEAAAVYPTDDLDQLAEYAGFGRSTARKAVLTLETLGIVKREDGGPFTVAVDGVVRGLSGAAMEQILRRAMLGFRPLEVVLEGFALGESQQDAIRKARLLLGISESDSSKLQLLLRWADDLGIVETADGEVRLVAELRPERAEDLGVLTPEDVESEARARLFNARRLGRSASNCLDEVDRGLLADALLKHESDPRKSIDASGQALEDFLRHVADAEGLAAEAKKQSGAGQLANLLHTKGVIHTHQQKLVDATATVRNATAHRKDKKTLEPWELMPFGAFTALATTLTAIRSIHAYISSGRQTI